MITKSGYATKKSNVTQEKVNSYRQLLNEPAQEETSTPVVQEQVKPVNIRDLSVSNVLPKPKVNISAGEVKPLNIRDFVNEINNTPEGKRANLTVQTDSLKKQINTKEQEYARANNISDWNTKRQEQSRIQQELNSLREQLDSKNKDLVMLGGYNLLSGEQVKQFNKNAPLTQKIDKALKYDIPTTAKKVGRTAMDLAMQIPTAAYDVYEGALDATVANVGAIGSTIADKTGNKDIANKIREGAIKFVNITPSSKPLVEEAKNKGEGIYEPKVLGIKVRDALYSISNMITAAYSGGLPMMALSASGQNIEEALTDNQSLERAVAYGDISGAIEGLTEKMFDAVKIVGGGKFDKFLPKSAIGKLIGGSAGEGIEEIISNGLNPFVKQLTYEKGTYDLPDFYEYIKMLGESFWNGAVIGAIMKGGQDISTPQFREQYKQDVYTAVDKSKLPNDIKETVKQAMITPAQQAINQDLENLRSTGSYQRTQTPTNTLPKFSEIMGKKIADTQIAKTSQSALPAPNFYATEKGEVITPNNYVAKQETKVPEQPNYSPVNSRQVLAENQKDNLQEVTRVDSLKDKEYNVNMRGEQNEFRRIQEEARAELNKSVEQRNSTENNEGLRERLSTNFRRELDSRGYHAGASDELVLKSNKGTEFKMHQKVDGNTFHDIFEIARAYTKNGELVDLHSVETTDDGIGYAETENYLSEDGMSGFAITPSGDLISVFNADSSKRGFLDAISSEVKKNAKTLDCFASENQNLMEMYEKKFGFKTASIMDYNMEYDHDDIAKNHNMPKVAFMVNTSEDVETKYFNGEQYSEAESYRNSYVGKKTAETKATTEKTPEVKTTTEKTTKKYISPITNTKEATDFVKNSTIDDIETLKQMAKEVGQKPTRVDLQFFAEELKKKIEGLEYAKTIKGKRLSKYAQTLANAGVTTAETQDMITKMVEEGSLTHEVIKDKTAKAYAENYIKENGFKDAVEHWNQIIKGGRELSKNDLALGMTIYNEANTNKDATLTKKMIVDLVTEGTHLGRGLQALSMINKLTPDGRLYSLERTAQKLNQELRDKIGKDYKDIEIPDDLADKLLNSQTEADTDAAVEEIQQYIADQVPATWEDKLNAWRYLSMLGNPRTHIRNIFGNAVFIPAVEMKNLIAMQGERLLPQELRTKAVLTKKDADLLNFAAEDFNSNQQAIRGENKYDIKAGVQEKRTIYNNKFLETLRKKNFELLEKEDATFLKFHYERAMARAIKAKGLSLDDIRSGKPEATKMLNEIRNYAINEAQKATYRDANAVASWISAQKRRLSKAGSTSKLAKVGSMAVEGIVPFAKTPANILKRGIEYSPIGLIKGVYDVTKGVKSEKITATQAIDELSAGLTGTGIMMLGVLLKSLGLITGGDKEKEKEQNFNELKGYQNYALKIGNKTYTIDWMAPASMPLFVGVELADLIQNKETADIIKSLGNITDPVFELSMLQGINSIMNTLGERNPIGATLSKTFQSYLGQYNPTLLGQLARTIDPVRRTTYTKKDSILPSGAQYFLQRQVQKIPFATKTLPSYKDEFGREDVTENVVERIFSNFLSPGYLEDVKDSPVENELSKLYENTGETGVLPTAATKQITVNKEKINLNSKEYGKFAKARGNVAYQNLEKLVTSKEYKSMEDADKVNAIKNIYEYANAIGKTEVSDYKLTKSEQLIKTYEEAGIDYYKWLILKEKADTDDNDYISKDEMNKALNKSDLTSEQKKLIRTTFNKK